MITRQHEKKCVVIVCRFTIKYTQAKATVLKYDRKWSVYTVLYCKSRGNPMLTRQGPRKKRVHTKYTNTHTDTRMLERKPNQATEMQWQIHESQHLRCSKINCGSATCLIVQQQEQQQQQLRRGRRRRSISYKAHIYSATVFQSMHHRYFH